jgi:CRP-like cAMP-binding protein
VAEDGSAVGDARNAILASLPRNDLDFLSPLLREVAFDSGAVILERGPIGSCLFVETGLVSLMYNEPGGVPVEVGMVGPDGMIGVAAAFGVDVSAHYAVALTRTLGWSVESAALQPLIEGHRDFRGAVLRYTNQRLLQGMRLSACHLRHPLEQRLAGWIEAACAILRSSDVAITHSRLAQLVGVTRSSATLALEDLEGKRAIWSKRGRIFIRSARRLHDLACTCYSAGLEQIRRERGGVAPSASTSMCRAAVRERAVTQAPDARSGFAKFAK